MRTKMPDELKINDRLVVRNQTGGTMFDPVLSIISVHVPVGPLYIPAFEVRVLSDTTPLLLDPRIAVEVGG